MIPDDYKFWCDHYLKELDEIEQGIATLPLPTGSGSRPKSTTEGQARIFTRTKFDDDGNVLNEEEDGSLDVV